MEIRSSTELGLKNVESSTAGRDTRTPNPANLPGEDYSNRQRNEDDRKATSIRSEQATDHYKVIGGSVNIIA
jgi:hypothetical protein